MGKKTKGKQKQEDKPASSNEMPNPPPTEPDSWGMSTGTSSGHLFNVLHSFGYIADNMPSSQPEPQPSTWGAPDVQSSWGSTTQSAAGGWGTTAHEQHDTWGQAESLLQPPPNHAHSTLPTIHEQPSHGQFAENRPLSDVGESPEEYSEFQQDIGSPQAWDHPQSQTLTATAAPSVMGSPAPPPVISLAEAAAVAQKDIQKQQKVSTASEAAKRLEESRIHLNKGLSTAAQSSAVSPAVRFEELTAQAHPTQTKPISKASTAAAAMESSLNRHRNSKLQPSEPPQPGKTSWTYPKPFLPNGKTAARIEPDPSWTTLGGNAWSRKPAQGASVPPNWSPSKEEAWNQQLNYLRQARDMARHTQQGHPHPAQQQRPHHSKHHSHPGHSLHQQHRPQPPQNQSWQGWGKETWDQEEEEAETEEETIDAWGTETHHGDNEWGSAWGPQSTNPGKGHGKHEHERGRGRGRKHDDQWGAGQPNTWGHPAQGSNQAWDTANNDLGQQAGQPNGRGQGQTNDAWGQASHQNNAAWGQAGESWGQADNNWGNKADAGAWGNITSDAGRVKGASESGWGKPNSESGWGKGTDNGEWGGGANNEWGGGGGANTDWGGGGGANNEWGGGATTNGDWGPNAHVTQQSKVTFASADPAGSRNDVSAQQRSQILNSLLNLPQNQKPSNIDAAHKAAQQASAGVPKKGHQRARSHQDAWGAGNWDQDHGWGSVEDDEDEDNSDDDGNRRVHFSPKASDIWGGSPRSVPSKSLSHANNAFKTTLINDASNVRFVESRGAAFDFVSEAFFGNARLARDRIHWRFPEDKDQRVANMLNWVQKMSFNLGTYGLLKFLERRERGALFVNTIFRMHQHPREPAFDYLTFNQLQGTMDKTLQESVAFYDPARLVIVFVYLPSQTGNSVAVWRRKIPVPDNARLKYQAEVDAIVKTLRKDNEYVVMVDELPPKPKAIPQKPGQLRKSARVKVNSKSLGPNGQAASDKKKRKWWKLFLS